MRWMLWADEWDEARFVRSSGRKVKGDGEKRGASVIGVRTWRADIWPELKILRTMMSTDPVKACKTVLV